MYPAPRVHQRGFNVPRTGHRDDEGESRRRNAAGLIAPGAAGPPARLRAAGASLSLSFWGFASLRDSFVYRVYEGPDIRFGACRDIYRA